MDRSPGVVARRGAGRRSQQDEQQDQDAGEQERHQQGAEAAETGREEGDHTAGYPQTAAQPTRDRVLQHHRRATIMVDEGPRLKRMTAKAMGRGARILKKTSHITVVVEDVEPTPVVRPHGAKAKPRPTFAAKPVRSGNRPVAFRNSVAVGSSRTVTCCV